MKKKIIYVTSKCPFDNWEVWAIGEINSLIEAGADIRVIPRTASGKILSNAANEILKISLIVPFFNLRIFTNLVVKIIRQPNDFFAVLHWVFNHSNSVIDFFKNLYVLPKSFYLGKICKNEGYHHVHAFSTTTVAVVAYIVARELSVPWSLTFHSAWHLDNKHIRSTHLQLKTANFVRAISYKTKDAINQYTDNKFTDKIVTLHLGVKVNVPQIAENTKSSKFNIISVGWLLPHKGIDISIETVRIIKDRGVTNFKWYFYGEGPLLGELKEKAINLEVMDFVGFCGNIENKALLELYTSNQIDLLVQNSVERFGISEGIPVSIMEAMACSVPVIATDCGGTNELVDGKTGVLINQNNSELLADKIIELIEDEELRKEFSQSGKMKIIQEFDSQTISGKLIQLF